MLCLEVMEMDAAVIGERLRFERERAGMQQKAAAARLGISNDLLSKYESGRIVPRADFIQTAATLYQCSTDYLLGQTNRRSEHPADGIRPSIARRIGRIMQLSPKADEDIARALDYAEYEVLRKLGQNHRPDPSQ